MPWSSGGWHMGGMWIWWVIPLVVVVWLLGRGRGGREPRREPPEEILKRRYASGEIDRETYDRSLADLRK